MKKVIYSALAGALLFGSLAAVSYAATSGLIGKKVQGVVAVSVNGKSVKDAVVIDGTTYAPVRSFSEAAGYTLNVEGGAVKLTSPQGGENAEFLTRQIEVYKQQIGYRQSQITSIKDEVIKPSQEYLDKMNELSKTDDVSFLDLSGVKKKIEDGNAQISTLQSEIDDYQKKIDAANEEIAKQK